MNIQRLLIPVAALAVVCAAPPVKAQDDEVRSLDELLNLVETAGGRDAAAEKPEARNWRRHSRRTSC